MVELRLFGSFHISSGGKSQSYPKSRKAQYLLALLALRNGDPVERVELAAVLWPDSARDLALYNLRRELTELRTLLGSDAVLIQSPSRSAVRLDTSKAQCDLLSFDAETKKGTTSALEAAVSLYRGPLLEGCNDEWLLPDRRRREAEYLRALESLAAQAPPDVAVRYLRLLLASDPSQERAQRRLMRSLTRLGDHAGAMRAYAGFRRYLKKELGVSPCEETIALKRRILLDTRRKDPAALDPSEQVVRLPEPATALVGREDERAIVARLLTESRIVTLVGAGGVGKTRLALSAARHIAASFAGGVWFADLSTVFDASRVATTVAFALDALPAQSDAVEDCLTRHIADRALLIVIDNCEQVRDSAAALIARMLRECQNIRVLATSRIPLGVKPEITFRVPSLAVPREMAPINTLAMCASVRLFLDRACAISPHFKLDDDNVRTVAQICTELDGIPLAIELAAARVRTLTPADIAAHLGERLRLLTATRSGALRRRQTMQASTDWSWDLLGENERACLTCLSVFAGSFSAEAAEHVVAAGSIERWDVVDLLDRLVDWGLLSTTGNAEAQEQRFRLLETVRQYAADRLRERGDNGAVRRHRAYFNGLAVMAKPYMGGSEWPRWMKRLESEHDNLRAALDSAKDDISPEAGNEALSITSSLSFFWLTGGHVSEGRARLADALSHPAAQLPTFARASALRTCAMLATRQHDFAQADELCMQSLELFRDLNEPKGVGDALMDLGNQAFHQRRLDDARSLYEESAAIYRSINEAVRANRATANLGAVERALGNLDAAEECVLEVLAAARAMGEKYNIAVHLSNLGTIRYYRGDLESASLHIEEANRMLEEMGHRDMHLAINKQVLALTYVAAGKFEDAKHELREAAVMCADIDEIEGSMLILDAWIRFHRVTGKPQVAARLAGSVNSARVALDTPRDKLETDSYLSDEAAIRQALGEKMFSAQYDSGAEETWRHSLEAALFAAGECA